MSIILFPFSGFRDKNNPYDGIIPTQSAGLLQGVSETLLEGFCRSSFAGKRVALYWGIYRRASFLAAGGGGNFVLF